MVPKILGPTDLANVDPVWPLLVASGLRGPHWGPREADELLSVDGSEAENGSRMMGSVLLPFAFWSPATGSRT